jgi:hypothetical protein
VVSITFEDQGFKALAEKVICVAGHKVTTDPVAIPFSMVRVRREVLLLYGGCSAASRTCQVHSTAV